jgi:hypothetical protein
MLCGDFDLLRVTIEILPGGNKEHARAIAVADIANISDLSEVSDYAVSVTERYNPVANSPAWSRRGFILQHARRASVWALVAKVAAWAAESDLKTGKTGR